MSFMANSKILWRQAPQGITGSALSARIRISAICRSPALTIAAIAAASAQVPTGYAAFSTFAPEYMAPDPLRMAAPTGNRE